MIGFVVLVDLAMLLKRRKRRTLIKSRGSTVWLLKPEARNQIVS